MNAIGEIVSSVSRPHVWGPIAWRDVLGRYRRTMLGPFWMILPQVGLIGGIYLLHRTTLGAASPDFLVYLAISLPLWGLLSALVVDAAATLVAARGYIEAYPMPPAIHIVRNIARAVITFAHLLVVYVVVQLHDEGMLPLSAIAALPGLAIVLAFGLGVGLGLGALGARFRDVAPALTAVMSLGFVLTPVFWIPNAEQLQSPLVRLNPFFYLLEVVRQPLIGSWGEPGVWLTAATIAVITLGVGAAIYVRQRATLIYWL